MSEEEKKLVDYGCILIPSEINEDNVTEVIKDILKIALNDSIRTIQVYINSYGGNCDAERQIIDSLIYLKNIGKKIVTTCSGIAASAAFNIFITGDERRITKYSILMSHRYSGGVYMKHPDLVAARKWEDWLHEISIRHCMDCLGWTKDKVESTLLTKEDQWFLPEESLKLGLSTEVI